MNIVLKVSAQHPIITIEQQALEVLDVPACAEIGRRLRTPDSGVQPREVPSQGKLSVIAERCPSIGHFCSDDAKQDLFKIRSFSLTIHLAIARFRRRTEAPPLPFRPFFGIHTAAPGTLK